MRYLTQNTATTVVLGPLVAWTDGVTPKTSLTLGEIAAAMYKGTARSTITVTASGGDNDFTHVADGYWKLELTASNTDTAGRFRITLRDDDVFLPVWADFEILPTNVSGVADTWQKMLVQLWRRFFRKATMTSTELKTYADNGEDVLTTQSLADDDTTQTQGPAT